MLAVDTIAAHLRHHYVFHGDIAIEHVPTGRASNSKVSSAGQSWLFKVLQPEYTRDRFRGVADFVRYLARAGYPVRELVPNKAGEPVTVIQNRATPICCS